MKNVVFGKAMENVRKRRNIIYVTTERRINYLVPEPNYHTTKFFTEMFIRIEIKNNNNNNNNKNNGDTYE